MTDKERSRYKAVKNCIYLEVGFNQPLLVSILNKLWFFFFSLFGAMFPLPRIIYAMANDGVIFKFLGKVHPRFQTPVIGTLVAGVFTGHYDRFCDFSFYINDSFRFNGSNV